MPRPKSLAKLEEYRRKRNFEKTPEPAGAPRARKAKALRFVIQKHAASHLHYDLRLEMNGVMRSWAVPKGPSIDPKVRRLAMEVEDHPIEYNDFEGTIPKGEYGGGTVMLWDHGTYEPDEPRAGETPEKTLLREYHAGKISFTFHGERLQGSFALVRTDTVEGGVRSKWLFFKHKDEHADPAVEITEEIDTSVVTGRTMDEIAAGEGGDRVWHSNRGPDSGRGGRKSPVRSKRSAPDLSSLRPMLAKGIGEIPASPHWVYEPKYDGIRVLALASGRSVALITRNGHDKSKQFPEVADALKALIGEAGESAVLDGEIVPLQGDRIGRFELLQGRMHVTGAGRVRKLAEEQPVALVVFDALLVGDDVLIHDGWSDRRARLEGWLDGRTNDVLRISETADDREELVRRGEEEGWEGVMAKRRDSVYKPGQRTNDWLKLKLENRQELVVGGWTEPRKSRAHLGAILLGYYDDQGDFIYAGHTGTGFDGRSLTAMAKRLAPLERKTSPFTETPKTNERAHWTTPKVVVEVRFNEWTKEGKLRQPVFLGVRDDKDSREVVREPVGIAGEGAASGEPAGSATDGAGRRTGAGKKMKAAEASPHPDSPADGGGRRKRPEKKVKAADAGPGGESMGGSASGRSTGESATQKVSKGRLKKAVAGSSKKPTRSARKTEVDIDTELSRRILEMGVKGSDGKLQLSTGTSVAVTSLDKIFYPQTGHTKQDLLVYYARMADYILPWMEDRPLVLKRFPNGVEQEAFYQQAAPDPVPPGVRAETVVIEGKKQRRLVGGDLATLLYTVQLGAISYDPWHSRVGSLESADYTILDLDPGPEATLRTVVEVARRVRAEMDALNVHGALKTSGSRGLHIYIPLPPETPLDAATLIAQIIATRVAQKYPKIATVERYTKNRPSGTIYVDYLQNILGKTVAGVYAARAKGQPTVSTPVAWDELTDDFDLADYTIDTVPGRVREVGDLWSPAMAEPISIEKMLAAHGRAG